MKSGRHITLLSAAIVLAGCGGVFEGPAQSKLVLHLSPANLRRNALDYRVAVRLPYFSEHLPLGFFEATPSANDSLAYLTPNYRWSAALVVIPPLGLVPPRPAKPAFIVNRGSKEFYVGPNRSYAMKTLGAANVSPAADFLPANYVWSRHLNGPTSIGGWEAEVDLPPQ